MDYMFGSLGIHKCELDVSSDNPRAIRCYEKVGFVKEGVLRSNYLKNGVWLDVSIERPNIRRSHLLVASQNWKMGLLEDEWRAGKAARSSPKTT